MNRDTLRDMGLDDSHVDTIMAEFGKLNTKAAKVDELQTEISSLNGQVAERDKQFKDLEKAAGDNKELTAQLDALKATNKEQAEQHKADMLQLRKDSAISQALTESGALNAKAVRALLDGDTIKVQDDGTVSGLKEQLDGLRESDGYMFKQTEQDNKPSVRINAGGNPSSGNDVPTLKNLDFAQRVELKQSDPDKYNAAVAADRGDK